MRGNKIILRDKNLAGAWNDYLWETDPELAKLDATPSLTLPFSQYLSGYLHELRYPPPTSRRFAIETPEGKHIGNCSLYNINEAEGEAELGIMIGNRDYWNKGYGTDVIVTLLNYVFCQTELNRIYLKTLASNGRAQRCFQKCSFSTCGHSNKNGFHFVLMEIHRSQWQKEPKTQLDHRDKSD